MTQQSSRQLRDEMARARIVQAMVVVVHERGFTRTTVTAVCGEANVGRGTFYQAFDSLQDCFLAVIDDAYRRARVLIVEAFAGEERWQDGVRAALASLLALFDREPRLAHVWLLETLAAGSWALERRERHVAALRRMIVESWPAPSEACPNPLAAAGVMESVLGIIRAHLLNGDERPLLGLLGPLMGLVAMPYLDPRTVSLEIERGEHRVRTVLAERNSCAAEHAGGDVQIPGMLRDARAHRARHCLRYLLGRPGASNRQIAAAVGIHSDTHISSLLARLRRMGLLTKHPCRPGGPNAWALSPLGSRVAKALQPPMTMPLPIHGSSRAQTLSP